jgi:hypothetical protein
MAFSKKTKEKILGLETQIAKKDEIIKKMQEEIESFSIMHKYYLFDVEATRRERDHYLELWKSVR